MLKHQNDLESSALAQVYLLLLRKAKEKRLSAKDNEVKKPCRVGDCANNPIKANKTVVNLSNDIRGKK